MTCISIPFVCAYALQGLGGLYEASQDGWIFGLGQVGMVFFAVYLFGEFVTISARTAGTVADTTS